MLKALGIFVRLVCSLVVLLAVALYLQVQADPYAPGLSPEAFAAAVTPETVMGFFMTLNWVSITAAALVLCALLRLLDVAWNVAFCLSFVPVLFCGMWTVWGPAVALPAPLQGNPCMTEFCTLPESYPVPALIVMGIFAMGWLASTAPFRIAFSTLLSFGLWYGLTWLMHWGIMTRWADTPEPARPEVLAMLLANPWMIAALPAAFFLVYVVLVAFFETFLSSSAAKKKPAAPAEEKPAEAEQKEEQPEPKPEAEPASTLAAKPAVKKVKPVLKPVAKPAPAAEEKSEPKPEEKSAAPAPVAKPEVKKEEKPEGEAEAPAPAAKTEAEPADKTAETPAADKPADAPAEPAASAEKA